MALRKASAYSKKHVVPFTRISKLKGKAYVKTVPPQAIVKFSMGYINAYREGKLPNVLTLVSEEKCQVRHNALEASRQYIHKILDTELPGQYYFRVIPYPHHIQRENKMLTGAGSDRMQTGMQLSFGKSVGKAALIKPGGKIFMIAVPNEKGIKLVRDIYAKVRPKLPCRSKVVYEQKTREMVAEENL